MIRRFCHRYGPGRLPYAARRDVGGAIAMAATGLLASLLWFGGAGLLLVTGIADGTLGFLVGVGLFFLPVAIPLSFLGGLVCWRRCYPESGRQRFGAIAGGLTALGSLAGGAVGPAAVLAVSNARQGEMAFLEAVGFGVLLVPIGFLTAMAAAGWLVVPLGVLGGWYHERAKAPS